MKTSHIKSCINICRNNPDYRIDAYLAQNELDNLIDKISALKNIISNIRNKFNSVANKSIDYLDLSEAGSEQDIDIENGIIYIKELINSVNELYKSTLKD